jgi:zinc metalloprotease ZmpB
VSSHYAPTPDPACVADWDSVSYTAGPVHCLRRLDEDKHYPADLTGEPHADGEIWSRALWDIRGALGATKADTLILEGQFGGAVDPTMPSLAQATVAAAQKLYGAAAASAVRAAFHARGIL